MHFSWAIVFFACFIPNEWFCLVLLEIEMVEWMVSFQSFGDEDWHLIRWMNELMSEFYKTNLRMNKQT